MIQPWTAEPLSFASLGSTTIAVPDHTLTPFGEHGLHDQEELFAELWQRDSTLVLPLHKDRVLVDAAGRLALVSPRHIDRISTEEPLRLYLGRVQPDEGIPDDGVLVAGEKVTQGSGEVLTVPVIAAILNDQVAEALAVGTWESLREVTSRLDPLDVGLCTRAVALANWHRNNQYSPQSGRATTSVRGGWVRRDTTDGAEHFPRTDPAVIIAVTDSADRILLASNMAWDERVYSLIAGFVDPGESLEQAVMREVFEESGLRVRAPQYLGSQPWPFPASLMLGFQATLDDSVENGRPDGVEIRSLRWFSRDDLTRAIEASEVVLPGGVSISRAIISTWHGAL